MWRRTFSRGSAKRCSRRGSFRVQAELNKVRGWLEKSPSMHAATKFLLTLFAGLPEVSVRPPLIDLSAAQRAEFTALAVSI